MSTCVNRVLMDSPLSSKVALFNAVANKHMKNQAINPFSTDNVMGSKPKISKEDYGKPPKGSLSESRAYKATIAVCKEMLELCEVIHENGEYLFTPEEKPDDPRKVISFGEIFTIYTAISDKVVGLLLRTRKYKLVEFEGECLFQRRDEHIPIILLKPIAEIRQILKEKIDAAKQGLKENEELQDQLL